MVGLENVGRDKKKEESGEGQFEGGMYEKTEGIVLKQKDKDRLVLYKKVCVGRE